MVFPLSFAAGLEEQAQQLARNYNFSLSEIDLPRLHLTSSSLELCTADFKPICIDFNDPKLLRRSLDTKNQGLLKACKPRPDMKIIDATAGLGRDSMLLASHGADVLMLERNPVLAAMLADACRRVGESASGFGSLSFVHNDAKSYLHSIEMQSLPDVVYIDPMHPSRKKSALVKKEMQILQSIVGADIDALELLNIAQCRAKNFVVVKWPEKLDPLAKPQYSIHGTTVRFDVYRSKR